MKKSSSCWRLRSETWRASWPPRSKDGEQSPCRYNDVRVVAHSLDQGHRQESKKTSSQPWNLGKHLSEHLSVFLKHLHSTLHLTQPICSGIRSKVIVLYSDTWCTHAPKQLSTWHTYTGWVCWCVFVRRRWASWRGGWRLSTASWRSPSWAGNIWRSPTRNC